MQAILAHLPWLLILLSALNIVAIRMAHLAIIGGNWFKHRNLMLVSLALWGLTLLLFAAYLLRHGFAGLLSDVRPVYGAYLGLAAGASVLVVLTLWRMLKHMHLPHKLMGRKAIPMWMLTCLVGVVTFATELWFA